MFGEDRFSLLYHFDSPAFVTVYAAVLWTSCAAFMIGLGTRFTKWITWFLFLGMMARNSIALAGDHVLASFLFCLCLSRCDESSSVDAWIRHRRDPALPHHRPIPGWPRNLMLLLLIPMTFANGLAQSGKWGELWREGDVVYWIANHPWYQAVSMWEVSAMFGTNLFRAMTWAIQLFELLFPLVLVGLVCRFLARQELARPSRSAMWIARVLFVLIGLDVVYLATARFDMLELPSVVTIVLGVALTLAPLTLRLARRMPVRLRELLLGRRLGAIMLFVLGAQLFFVLDVNAWTGAILCSAVLLFEGDELARAWAHVTRRPVRATAQVLGNRPSPLRRRAIAVLSGLHVLAMAAIVLPHDKPMAPWRAEVEQPLKAWVFATSGVRFQRWRMFAWKGNYRIDDVEVALRDSSGNEWDVGDGILALDDDRALNRRQKARHTLRYSQRMRVKHARWVCRNFTTPSADDELTVVFHRVTQSMPKPAELVFLGPEDAAARMEASRRWSVLSMHPCDP